jgi:hypothetical protein
MSVVIDKTKKCQTYLLYKHYNSLIEKVFVGENITNMKKKELNKYYLRLKIMYIYSKKCVELREEYKTFLDETECDSTHELAINIVKKYNRDIEEYIKKIDELMKKNDIKLEKYPNKNIYKILDNREENSDEESNLEKDSNFEEEYKETKKETKSDFCDYDEDDEYLNYILERKEREKKRLFNAIESILIKFKLNYNDEVLFFLVQEISFELFKISPRWITSQQQYDLVKYIETMSKYDLVSNVVRVRKQLDSNVDCNMDEMDKFVNINITMGGEGGIGEIRVIAEQNQTISEVINRVVHNLKIDDSVEMLCRKLLGEKYMFSTQQYSVSKKSKIDPTKKVFEVLNDEQRIYLHLL